jgi:hypothetical protein
MPDVQMITLITVIANLVVTPVIQYLLASKCTKIKCCCGLVDIDRVVTSEPENNIV